MAVRAHPQHQRQPKANVANAITALRLAPEWKGAVCYNVHALQTIARQPLPWEAAGETPRERPWSPRDDVLTAKWLQHNGIDVNVNIAQQAIEAVAQDTSFHPIRAYLTDLTWDSTPRVDLFAARYLGAEDIEYTRAIGRYFLISAVARIFRPGAKVDHAPILEGKQGTRKSSALEALGRPWFTDELGELGSKDAAMQIRAAWIVEIAELDAMTKAQVERIKAFLTRRVDRFQPPYGTRIVESPRQNVFAGTTNSDTYLRDETGGRRFWPLKTGKIDIDAIVKDRDQLWAEAVQLYHGGAKWWPTSRISAIAAIEQTARRVEDPWESIVLDYCADREWVTIANVLGCALGLQQDRWGQKEQNRVARCLKGAGWERRQKRNKTGGSGDRPGKSTWIYVPVTTPQPPLDV
jgi:predicted P-loop ATPase